jgi:hypothetical protein
MRLLQAESDSFVLGNVVARQRDRAGAGSVARFKYEIAFDPNRARPRASPRARFGIVRWERQLPDIAVAEIPVDEEERPLPPPEPRAKEALLAGPILRTLLRLAWPNVIALGAGTCVVIAETSYIGRLGVESLAAMALVSPFVILTMTMSGGAMGGGVASAIARALGAGDADRASALAAHALLIGICFGLTFMLVMLIFGPSLLALLGGRGHVLANAIGYAQIFFGGAVLPWLMNSMAGILRGTGNMKLPSLMVLSAAVLQIVLGGTLGLGLGPVPQFGMPGVAAGSLIAYLISISVMGWYLFSGRARVIPKVRNMVASSSATSQSIVSSIIVRLRRIAGIVCCRAATSHSLGDVHRYPESRRGLLFLPAAIGAPHQYLHAHAGGFRHRGSGRLRHRGAARIHVDLGGVRDRDRIGADDRDGDRCRTGGAGAADRLDRGLGFVRCGRLDRNVHRDLPRSLGQHLYQRSRRARRQPGISVDRRADVRLHRARVVDVIFIAGRGQGCRAGAGAKRAAVVHRVRRLVAVDARCDGRKLLRAGGGFDGGARRVVRLERYSDAVGAKARGCGASPSRFVRRRRLSPGSDGIRADAMINAADAATESTGDCAATL